MSARIIHVAALILTSVLSTAHAACVFDKQLPVPPQPGLDTKWKQAYSLGDGSQVFLGRLFIDADGAPRAYHCNNAVALDTLDNADAG